MPSSAWSRDHRYLHSFPTRRSSDLGGGDELHTDRADVDPGARGKLEVLGDAAVEHDALRRVVGVGELHRIADAVKPLVIERRARQIDRKSTRMNSSH